MSVLTIFSPLVSSILLKMVNTSKKRSSIGTREDSSQLKDLSLIEISFRRVVCATRVSESILLSMLLAKSHYHIKQYPSLISLAELANYSPYEFYQAFCPRCFIVRT